MNEDRPGDQRWQYCPVEGSSLLHFGFESPSPPRYGVLEYYCPLCDMAFLSITKEAPLSAGMEGMEGLEEMVEILAWKRVDGQLRIVEEKPAGYFSDQQWEDREKNLLHHVQGFLDDRAMTERQQLPCLFDGLSIPVIYRLEDPDLDDPLTIAWCESCKTAFAYVRDSTYGWEAVCMYEWDASNQRHELVKLVRHRGASHLSWQAYSNMASLLPRPPGDVPGSVASAS